MIIITIITTTTIIMIMIMIIIIIIKKNFWLWSLNAMKWRQSQKKNYDDDGHDDDHDDDHDDLQKFQNRFYPLLSFCLSETWT